jgi:hypothetical protein
VTKHQLIGLAPPLEDIDGWAIALNQPPSLQLSSFEILASDFEHPLR